MQTLQDVLMSCGCQHKKNCHYLCSAKKICFINSEANASGLLENVWYLFSR